MCELPAPKITSKSHKDSASHKKNKRLNHQASVFVAQCSSGSETPDYPTTGSEVSEEDVVSQKSIANLESSKSFHPNFFHMPPDREPVEGWQSPQVNCCYYLYPLPCHHLPAHPCAINLNHQTWYLIRFRIKLSISTFHIPTLHLIHTQPHQPCDIKPI